MRQAPIRSFTVLTAAVLAAAHGAVQSTASLDGRRPRTEAAVMEARSTIGIGGTGSVPGGAPGTAPLTVRLHGVASLRP